MFFRRRGADSGDGSRPGPAVSAPAVPTRPDPSFPQPWWKEILGIGTWRALPIATIGAVVVMAFVVELWGWGPARDMAIAMAATLGSMWWQRRRKSREPTRPQSGAPGA